jgi:chaperonin cofactor prefoldin
MKKWLLTLTIGVTAFWFSAWHCAFAMTPQEEKELFRIIGKFDTELKQLNQRMDLISNQIEITNKRIDDLRAEMNARFAAVDKRFEELDKRFEQIDKRFEQIDKRFEQMDKRFEQMDKRFSELISFLGWIAGGFFSAVIAFVALLLWDRRTAVRSAVRQAQKDLEEKYELDLVKRLVSVLRERARTDSHLADILKHFNLL